MILTCLRKKNLCLGCQEPLILIHANFNSKTTTSYFRRKPWPIGILFSFKIRPTCLRKKLCIRCLEPLTIAWSTFLSENNTSSFGQKSWSLSMIFSFEIRPTCLHTHTHTNDMTWVSRTFSIALCLFSYENNELLFWMKILTHKYDMFIQNKTDFFMQKKKTMP